MPDLSETVAEKPIIVQMDRDMLTPHPSAPPGNSFLADLPTDVYARLSPSLTPISLPQGGILYEQGGSVGPAYFPTSGTISLLADVGASAPEAITCIGPEGLFCASLLMGGRIPILRAQVQSGGYGYSLEAATLQREFESGSLLRYHLQRYTRKLAAALLHGAGHPVHPVPRPLPAHLDASASRIPHAAGRATPRDASEHPALRLPQRAA
ncbi:hypothetical protein [Nitrosovibrio sp. Nv17]|uniref:hypothetical protein n=1 Tax=Nitrosovibrio sp. Nv17 TaxID=1855339 RepID=UPI000908C15A|nr:hypothetical protein [Nitrosovibrio sp. Nv17]SFW16308.1 hypothetical protein SAMN05216414_103121 [Nitrosovibrio sp. Nv17]